MCLEGLFYRKNFHSVSQLTTGVRNVEFKGSRDVYKSVYDDEEIRLTEDVTDAPPDVIEVE